MAYFIGAGTMLIGIIFGFIIGHAAKIERANDE
jgi:hypothetical protein